LLAAAKYLLDGAKYIKIYVIAFVVVAAVAVTVAALYPTPPIPPGAEGLLRNETVKVSAEEVAEWIIESTLVLEVRQLLLICVQALATGVPMYLVIKNLDIGARYLGELSLRRIGTLIIASLICTASITAGAAATIGANLSQAAGEVTAAVREVTAYVTTLDELSRAVNAGVEVLYSLPYVRLAYVVAAASALLIGCVMAVTYVRIRDALLPRYCRLIAALFLVEAVYSFFRSLSAVIPEVGLIPLGAGDPIVMVVAAFRLLTQWVNAKDIESIARALVKRRSMKRER